MFWKPARLRTPEMLISAGIHRPTSAIATAPHLLLPLLTNTSTYPTHATTIAALPIHAVSQYDHDVMNPPKSPKASRA